jgi:Holliday junction resolvase RusA-like endonuclease
MIRLNIKPLSVNDAWKGRRFRTDTYKAYSKVVLLMLKKLEVPKGKLTLKVKFGFSSKGSDIDNPVKPLLDILQKKYRFNDNKIYRLEVDKEEVKKGEEYIEFELSKLK